MATTILLIRHAEKPNGSGPPFGVSIDGNQDHESLTPLGWQRAGALVNLLATGSALPVPTHLVASQVGPLSSSKRPRETLEPLAQRLGLAIDDRFLKEELGQLAQAILALDGVVLVCWEHHLIPSIANMLLNDASTTPQVWPDDRFDVIWRLDCRPTGGFEFRQLTQLILAGDRPESIAP